MSATTMTGEVADNGLWALLPRVVLYSALAIWAAWFYHLIQPALVAALSPDYTPFNWVSGKKTIGSFLNSTYHVAFKSREIFKDIHHKV